VVSQPASLPRPRSATAASAAVVGWLGRAVPPLLAAAGALLLALSAMLPGVAFWDTAEFQTVPPVLGTAHSPGYPTYVILGWLANMFLSPFGEPAFRMNLFAGLSVAAAAALTVVLVRLLTGRVAIGVAAGLGLAATPLAWRVGTHAEPHALHLAFVALVLVLLVRWEVARRRDEASAGRWLVAAAGAFGLAAGNHSLTLLLAPAVGIYVLAVQPGILGQRRLIASCAVALFGTLALVYLELPLRAGVLPAPLVYGRPDTWDGFWYIVLAQQFQGSVGNPFADLPGKIGGLAAMARAELGVLALLVPLAAIVTIWRFPRYGLMTGIATLVTVVFAASYANADIQRYYLGPLLMVWTWLAVLAATGVEGVLAVGRGLARPASGSVLRSAPAGGAPFPGGRGTPTARFEGAVRFEWAVRRDARRPVARFAGSAISAGFAILLALPAAVAAPAVHQTVDERSDDSARVWLDSALDQIAQNAVVVSWWSYSTTLWYAQKVEGRRPVIFVVDDRTMLDLDLGGATDVIGRYFGQRPVYVMRASDYDLSLVLAQYQLRPASGAAWNLYQVIAPVRAGA
jgi:hypothetical protein